jgi:hypothetical protein
MERLSINEGGPEFREPYQYQPLPKATSIRVLKLRGKHGDGTLHVSLDVVDLDDDPFFYALSYTWGNPHAYGVDFTAYFNAVNQEYSVAENKPVLCDGKLVKVQRNLLDFLDELQQVPASAQGDAQHQDEPSRLTLSGELVIWIDAICINQADMEERAVQVRIMDKVYSKAAHTIIWLGRADEYTPAAAETIKRVAAYPKDAFVRSEVKPFRNSDSEVYAKCNLPYTSWMDWCSLAALLKRQWFSRLWIIQETILSRSLVLLCGKHEISWADLVGAARNIEARCQVLGWSPSTMFIEIDQIAVPLEDNVVSLAQWRDYFHNKNPSEAWRFTLEELIYATWVFNATDARDKVYGILGLVDADVRAAWDIDYQSPPMQVFAVTTRRIIEQTRSLRILSCVQDASIRTIAPYPSWVPDYSLPYFNMMCNHGEFAAAGTKYATVQLLPSSPSGPASWSLLRLRGHVFDTIVETGNDRTDFVNSAVLLDPSWFELTLLLKTPYPATGQRRTEVLWRTLCADQDATSDVIPAPARFGALFKELVCAMVMVRAELEQEEVETEPDPAPDCAASFAQAMQRAKEIWADVGWDRRTPEEIRERTNGRPRFLARPEFGWLMHTLIKLQALAITEEGGEIADTPSWEELERYHESPTYVMRKKEGERRALVQPGDAGFINSFRHRYGKRKLFYTRQGYLGLGPASAAVGDVVCILPGAPGPFVCREDHNGGVKLGDDAEGGEEESQVEKLRLIGQSYVHGIMNGEALDLEGFSLKDIELL